MPARLHFSNSLDILADRLIGNLSLEGGDPLRVPRIATPSAAARDWLKVRLAEKSGIAANIAFPHLEILLWDRLAERDRHRIVPERRPARPLDGDAFQGLVLARLRAHPPEALREYLSPRAGAEDAARRLCQLSGRLAALFREYEYNRVREHEFPGVAESWMRGEPCFERRARGAGASRLGEIRALEDWQMEIYRALFAEGGLRDRWGEATKIYRYTLPQYAELALGDPLTPPPEASAPVFHLFGLSNVSPFHRDLIGRLADADRLGEGAARFEIYALNPCAEYWEDVLSLRERRALGRRALAEARVPRERVEATRPDAEERALGLLREEDDENGLLALFGKPGRETIKLWCQLTDHDFLEDFREPEGETLLARVRASMLHRAGPLAPNERAAPDASLRVRRAPDPRAEIAAARAGCAALLKADPALRPEDMAILMANGADAAEGLPLLQAAFSGGADAPGNLPVLLPETDAAGQSPLLRGLEALLRLGASDADRAAVLAFLDIPAARAAAGLEDARLDPLSEYLEAAGFQEGWEASSGNASLEAALERTLWAYAMDPADPAAAGLPIAPSDTAARLDREEASGLLEWLDALRVSTRPLRDGNHRSFPEWARLLRGLKDGFLKAGPLDARADVGLARFLDELESWGRWNPEGDDDAPETVDATLLRALFEDRFRAVERNARTTFLRGGVRVGALTSLRGLPFRHVWILGLSSRFPALAEAAPLDLRAYRRIPGESDPAARDLYALIETLAATSGSVSLSWPARGADGGDLQPSRALTGLTAWLETDVLPEGIPLAVEDVPEIGAAPYAPPAKDAAVWAKDPGREAARTTDWRRLEEFLENPATHAIRRRFRVNAWDLLDTDAEERSAALFLDRREDEGFFAPALRAALTANDSGSAATIARFERDWSARARGGRLPPPPFDALEEERVRGRLAAEVSEEAAILRAAADAWGLRFEGTLRLGPQGSERAEPPVLNLPALDASSLGVPLRLGGLFPWFFTGGEARAGWALRVEKGREFPAYLLLLCAAALPLPPRLEFLAGPARLFARDPKKKGAGIELLEAPGFAPERAREILADLLEDFVRAESGEGALDDLSLARIDAVLREASDDPRAVRDWTQALRDARAASEDAPGARITRRDKLLRALNAEVPRRAEEAVRRRALPYLEWRRALYARDDA